MIRVLLADNHQLLYPGIQAIFSQSNTLTLIGTTTSNQLKHLHDEYQPDVLLLGQNIFTDRKSNTFDYLQYNMSSLNILFMLDSGNSVCPRQLLEHGATGIILKSDSPEKLIEAVLSVAHGETWVSHSLLPKFIQPLTKEQPFELTKRELNILQLLVAEKTGVEIAQILHIGARTVRDHLTNIYTKLRVKSRVGATREAVKLNLVQS